MLPYLGEIKVDLMTKKGQILVFTGIGKGKTSTALGLSLRAISAGRKVLIIQFLKSPNTSGEQLAAEALGSLLTIKPMGRKGFIRNGPIEDTDRKMARQAVDEARVAFRSGLYDVIILDEANVAIHKTLIDVAEFLKLMDEKPESVELVITGRYVHPEIASRADLVLEMKKIKHHFDQGIPARVGIEY